ncbi:hypothetical protein Bca52824_064402 [Brassica carinata]|uniref:Uncharacterized protein n=1 Tax=Brassica carinata TaxID=52824 RepID=A0A8X7QIB6_BRACI|nr:hypothetical protein Bca52824_064402 [Brassica carinata]
MQARMDTQQQRLDSRGFAGCDGGGKSNFAESFGERRAALGMSQPDPEAERLQTEPLTNYFDDHDVGL